MLGTLGVRLHKDGLGDTHGECRQSTRPEIRFEPWMVESTVVVDRRMTRRVDHDALRSGSRMSGRRARCTCLVCRVA